MDSANHVRWRTDACAGDAQAGAAPREALGRGRHIHMNALRNLDMPSSWDASVGASDGNDARFPARLTGSLPNLAHFQSLRVAYRQTGGVARGDDLARLLEDRKLGACVNLAKLIVGRGVFAFKWQDELWIPMFQFDLRDLSLKMAHRPVLAELAPVFDNWALADWFAKPNAWLRDRSPVNVLGSNLPAVLDAARADRFIANG